MSEAQTSKLPSVQVVVMLGSLAISMFLAVTVGDIDIVIILNVTRPGGVQPPEFLQSCCCSNWQQPWLGDCQLLLLQRVLLLLAWLLPV